MKKCLYYYFSVVESAKRTSGGPYAASSEFRILRDGLARFRPFLVRGANLFLG
jgi:hypothetical protein